MKQLYHYLLYSSVSFWAHQAITLRSPAPIQKNACTGWPKALRLSIHRAFLRACASQFHVGSVCLKPLWRVLLNRPYNTCGQSVLSTPVMEFSHRAVVIFLRREWHCKPVSTDCMEPTGTIICFKKYVQVKKVQEQRWCWKRWWQRGVWIKRRIPWKKLWHWRCL